MAALVAGLLGIAGGRVHGAGCSGNACGDVTVVTAGSCFKATNTGSRQVKVTFRPGGFISAIARSLQPGESWVPQLGITPGCMSGYERYEAVYE
jgi:hypothetical protein